MAQLRLLPLLANGDMQASLWDESGIFLSDPQHAYLPGLQCPLHIDTEVVHDLTCNGTHAQQHTVCLQTRHEQGRQPTCSSWQASRCSSLGQALTLTSAWDTDHTAMHTRCSSPTLTAAMAARTDLPGFSAVRRASLMDGEHHYAAVTTGSMGAEDAWHTRHSCASTLLFVIRGKALVSIVPWPTFSHGELAGVRTAIQLQEHIAGVRALSGLSVYLLAGRAVLLPPRCGIHVLCCSAGTEVLQATTLRNNNELLPGGLVVELLEENVPSSALPQQMPRANHCWWAQFAIYAAAEGSDMLSNQSAGRHWRDMRRRVRSILRSLRPAANVAAAFVGVGEEHVQQLTQHLSQLLAEARRRTAPP